MRKLGQVCRGRGGWGRDTSLHPPPLQVWPGCAPSSSLPPFPGALQFRLGCLSCPLPPFGSARLVVIKAFRPPLRAQPRGARVGPPWPGGRGSPAQSLVFWPPRAGPRVPHAGSGAADAPGCGLVCVTSSLSHLSTVPWRGVCRPPCSRHLLGEAAPLAPPTGQLLVAGFLWKGPPNRAVQ